MKVLTCVTITFTYRGLQSTCKREVQKKSLGLEANPKNPLGQNEAPKTPILSFEALQVPRRDKMTITKNN